MNNFLFTKFQTKNQVEILFCILSMTYYLMTTSISGNRKFRMARCLFIARQNIRANIRLAFCGQLCLVSVNNKKKLKADFQLHSTPTLSEKFRESFYFERLSKDHFTAIKIRNATNINLGFHFPFSIIYLIINLSHPYK